MKHTLWAAALSVAPFLFAQDVPHDVPQQHPHSGDVRDRASYLLTFSLDETNEQILKKFGKPNQVADHSELFRVLQFRFNTTDKHDFSHTLCIRKQDGKLVSITRNTEDEENVDALFPPAMTTVHHWPSAENPQFSARVRVLSGDRVLIAMGSAKQGVPARQLTLMRKSALEVFMPWMAPQLEKTEAQRSSGAK